MWTRGWYQLERILFGGFFFKASSLTFVHHRWNRICSNSRILRLDVDNHEFDYTIACVWYILQTLKKSFHRFLCKLMQYWKITRWKLYNIYIGDWLIEDLDEKKIYVRLVRSTVSVWFGTMVIKSFFSLGKVLVNITLENKTVPPLMLSWFVYK